MFWAGFAAGCVVSPILIYAVWAVASVLLTRGVFFRW